jgi:hypothetical protein
MEHIMIVCDVSDENVAIVSFKRLTRAIETIDIMVNKAAMVGILVQFYPKAARI